MAGHARRSRLAGARAHEVLAKGSALDLRSGTFPATGASHTQIDHIPVLVARRENPACYDISVPRSYAASFMTWLSEAALDSGGIVKQPKP